MRVRVIVGGDRSGFARVIPLDLPVRWSIIYTVIWQVALLCAPAACFVYSARLRLAAISFYVPLALLGLHYALSRRVVLMAAVLVGCVPMLMLLRPAFYQNSITATFAAILLIWWIARPADIAYLSRDRLLLSFCALSLAYWWVSVLSTGFYATNLRILELTFGSAVIFLLQRFRSYLAAALWGVGVSTALIVAGLSRFQTDRLGLAIVGRQTLGTPQQIGLACSLILVLCLVDQGRWLGLRHHLFWKYGIAITAAAFLLLTTSRTCWLLALVALGALALHRSQRRYFVGAAAIVAFALLALTVTSRSQIVQRYFNKVVSSKRTMAQRTSGRYEMYTAFPDLFWQSPVWGLGPGAAATSFRTSTGTPLVLHSIFLHVGAELGVLGLAALVLLYTGVLRRAWVHRRITGEVVPLAMALGCCVDAFAHNSFNPLTGIFLGLALAEVSQLRQVRSICTLPYLPAPLQNLRSTSALLRRGS